MATSQMREDATWTGNVEYSKLDSGLVNVAIRATALTETHAREGFTELINMIAGGKKRYVRVPPESDRDRAYGTWTFYTRFLLTQEDGAEEPYPQSPASLTYIGQAEVKDSQ